METETDFRLNTIFLKNKMEFKLKPKFRFYRNRNESFGFDKPANVQTPYVFIFLTKIDRFKKNCYVFLIHIRFFYFKLNRQYH